MTENKVLVKEIQIDKGVFSIKSQSGKMSASESYKEQFLAKDLPLNAPKEFKEAIPDLYYAPKDSDLIKYNYLHGQINIERESILKNINNPSEDYKKKALIESSKKVLKQFGINDKTLIIYSPQITKKFEEQDEFCKISVSFNPEEKILYVKTELLPREKKNLPQEIVVAEMLDILSLVNNNPVSSPIAAPTNTTNPEPKKIDIDEIKKKYKFQKPQVQSISDILKKTSGEDTPKVETKTPQQKEDDHLKQIISDSLSSFKGSWQDNSYIIDHKSSGYLVPIERIDLSPSKIKIKSSSITNTELWTKFTPIHQCPRFEGALYIPDEYAPFCSQAKCNTACGADDGFVELSAARFRLEEESEIIKESFRRLQQFIDRCYSMMEEFQSIFGVDIKLDISSTRPFFYSEIYAPFNESTIQNYIEAYKTLYPEITDIRGKVDIDSFVLDDDYDPVSESGLVQEARMYNLQEMVRLGAKDVLNQTVKNKDGKVEGNFYLIDNGKIRYLLKPNTIEAYREDLYMGNVSFKKGLNEISNFVLTTLGGGRW